jgi:predicted phosphodiesterase
LRIGLASDSHGNLGPLERALEVFARAKVDRVFFLGGRLADLDAVLARRRGGSRDAAVPRTDGEFLAAVEGALSRQAGAAADPLGGRIVRVASRACPEYAAGGSARKQVDLVEGRICCLVHDKGELTREDIANATMLFHGNSGHAALVRIGPRYFVTPGHLRAPAPEGRPPSFAVLEVGARDLVLSVYSGRGEPLREDRASFAAGAKMAVR